MDEVFLDATILNGLNSTYIADLYEKSLITLQYGMSLNFGKLGFDFRINRGFGEKEIVYVDKVLGGNKNQIVRTDGLVTMLSAKYRF